MKDGEVAFKLPAVAVGEHSIELHGGVSRPAAGPRTGNGLSGAGRRGYPAAMLIHTCFVYPYPLLFAATIVATACGADKDTSADSTATLAMTTPGTDPVPTSGGTDEGLPPGAEACGSSDDTCSCWAEYNGGFEDMVFYCHDECVADQYSDGIWADAFCRDDGACCNPNSRCDEVEGVCNPAPVFEVLDLSVTADCGPMAPPDPIAATWELKIDNLLDYDLNAEPFYSTLFFFELPIGDSYDEKEQRIAVAPAVIGPVASHGMSLTNMQKTKALEGPAMDCFQCDRSVNLSVEFYIDVAGYEGVLFTAGGSTTVQCTF